MGVTSLGGRGYAKFVAAGTYFLRKYRRLLNDLNVYPVPDGDTGTNMYLTLRSACLEAAKCPDESPISEVAAAAAQGSLMGARGNSGVIISQMLRGFAHHVRHRTQIDTFGLATGLKEGVAAAKQALLRPVEGTIISVGEAAAESAYRLALHETDFYRLLAGVLRVANEALDKTPEQLPVLKEAGVVDAGGAGFVYFLEGALRFLPEVTVRSTAFPRHPAAKTAFTPTQVVGENKFCTEFVLEHATCSAHELRRALEPRGESLLVIGDPPVIKVHIHTDQPQRVQELAAKHGSLSRVKVDNMEQQHNVLVVGQPTKSYSIVAVVPGPGFERIVRELGAEVTVDGANNPSVRGLLLAANKALANEIFLFVNESNAVMAARELPKLTDKTIHVLPTANIVAGIAGLFALRAAGETQPPSDDAIMAAASSARAAVAFLAGKDATLGGVSVAAGRPVATFGGTLFAGTTVPKTVKQALTTMGAQSGGLVTLYYGGKQKEKDAGLTSDQIRAAFPACSVEYYYGGMKNAEYWVSLE